MTLDEAIKHCEEKEREQALNGCFSCAEEHKQLAEWLKDYKRLLEERTQGEWIYHDKLNMYFCKNCGLLEPFTKEEVEEGVKLPNFCQQCGADMRKPNCVTCDHFGKCEGCEKRNEE